MTRVARTMTRVKISMAEFMGSEFQGCCTGCEHSQVNLTFCYGQGPSRKVQDKRIDERLECLGQVRE